MRQLRKLAAPRLPAPCRPPTECRRPAASPGNDPFWQQFLSNLDRFARTDLAQPGIDTEVVSVLMLAGTFLWPVWARAHTRTAKERQQMAKRFTREVLRLCLHGTLRPEKYPDLEDLVAQSNGLARPRLT